MLVDAKVVAEAWDSKTCQYFYPGSTIEKFDTESELGQRLMELTTPRGKYAFQFPGHEGFKPKPSTERDADEEEKKSVNPVIPVAVQSKPHPVKRAPVKKRKPWSQEARKAQSERIKARYVQLDGGAPTA